jgi:hypothetical protein
MRRSAVRIRSQAPDQRVCDRNGRVHRISDRRWWTPGGSHYRRKGGPTLVAELSSRWSLARGGRPGRPNPIARLPLHPGDRSAVLGEPLAFSAPYPWNKCPKSSFGPSKSAHSARDIEARDRDNGCVCCTWTTHRVPSDAAPPSSRSGGGSATWDCDTGRGSRARRQ